MSETLGSKVNIAPIAESFREEVREKLQCLKEHNIGKPPSIIWIPSNDKIAAPLLVGILANNDPAAIKYSEWTRKTLESDGFRYELRTIPSPIDVERELTKANDDPHVHGIIVYYPIFGQSESFSGDSQGIRNESR